jgi:hypothetical protein
VVLEPDRSGAGPSAAPPPVEPLISMLLWTTPPFQTTVARAFAVFVAPLKRAARNVISYVCQVSGAVARFESGARLV